MLAELDPPRDHGWSDQVEEEERQASVSAAAASSSTAAATAAQGSAMAPPYPPPSALPALQAEEMVAIAQPCCHDGMEAIPQMVEQLLATRSTPCCCPFAAVYALYARWTAGFYYGFLQG